MSEQRPNAESDDDEKLYDLQEAAQILGKSEAALRMQIRRDSIPAVKRPLDETGRFKYVIAEGEIEKERERLRSSTSRAEAQRPTRSPTVADPQGGARPTAPVQEDARQTLNELRQRLDQIEREHGQEREDTRALIRALEKQVDLLSMMVRKLLES